jgi:RNA polymerase sigma-70 factor (ECF subfamily)
VPIEVDAREQRGADDEERDHQQQRRAPREQVRHEPEARAQDGAEAREHAPEAEDLAQEAIVRAYEAYDRFDGTNFKAWILRITTNLYINKYRSRQRGPMMASLEDENVAEPMSTEAQIPDRQLFDGMVGAEVEKALKSVPDEFRLAVILSDVEEMSYQEIADATGVPIGTVRSRIARGRAMLRRSLESYALKEGFIKEGEDL